jgi:hypothetical protein
MKQTDNGHANGKKAQAEQGFEALVYQVLETELGGVKIYQAAIPCILNADLKEEFEKYLTQTKHHVQVARQLLTDLGLDPDAEVPARMPVRLIGQGLLAAMKAAKADGTPAEAQLTAVECVVEAETKDHMNWSLVGLIAEKTKGDKAKLLSAACEEVEDEEDHHLYHSSGWARELWAQAVGLPAVLPPPEEERKVESAIGAARAKNARDQMLKH